MVVLVFVLDLLLGGRIRAAVRNVAEAIYNTGAYIAAPIAHSGFFSSRRALQAENESLKQQLATLQNEVAEYQQLKDENGTLTNLVHVAASHSGITAPVVSSFRSSIYGTFLIGAGSRDGIVKGDIVLTADPRGASVALGTVSDVGAHTSLVTEFFAPNIATDATIHGIGVSVVGSGGGNATAEAPRNAPITVGDAVLSPMLGESSIGVVGQVEGDESKASRSVYISLPVSLASLTFVYVVQQ